MKHAYNLVVSAQRDKSLANFITAIFFVQISLTEHYSFFFFLTCLNMVEQIMVEQRDFHEKS